MNFWFAQVVQKLLTEMSLSFCICDQLLMIKYFISVLHEKDHLSIYKFIAYFIATVVCWGQALGIFKTLILANAI